MTARVLDPASLTRCPDCDAPAFGGSHQGNCQLAPVTDKVVGSALIRRFAEAHEVVSANELRGRWERQGLNPNGLSAALTRAVKAGWLRKAGHTPSTDPNTKRHEVVAYQSSIYRQP
jgi:hypothetical protein